MIAVFAVLFSLPQSGFAQDEVSPDAGVLESADAGEPEPAEAEEPEPAEAEEPVLEEPFVPDVELEDDDDYGYEDDALQDALDDLPDGKPFAKGDIELGLGLGGYGSGDYFQLTIGGAFAYYVVNRLAPGIDLSYTHIFSSELEYPDSFTVLPFLKFVIVRSTRFAPYLILTGGRNFQWGGTDDPDKGYTAIGSWIFGGGAGAHIGLGQHVALKLQLLALYYWYDEKIIDDGKVKDGKLFFPVISIGIAFMF